jgi:hypothetical protein
VNEKSTSNGVLSPLAHVALEHAAVPVSSEDVGAIVLRCDVVRSIDQVMKSPVVAGIISEYIVLRRSHC